MRIQIVLFDGFDPLDVLGPFEVFHIGAGLTGGRLTVELVSAEGARLVPSGLEAVSLTATAALDPAADLVVVPGAVGALALDPEVDGGDLVSAGNVTSGIDLALHLIEREVGPQVAHAVEQVIRHERRGTVWRAAGVAVTEA
ncbi:hypothetical protein [Actinomycetospora sp. NBC_00405]|uniref:hypothetical protein n=1 Tax=Actinomycetospora sp. NBC_00405 TaxID=2975952 RepID=UPI002E1D484C